LGFAEKQCRLSKSRRAGIGGITHTPALIIANANQSNVRQERMLFN